MAKTQHCARCSAELPVDAPGGVCPKCLLEMGLGSQPESGETMSWRSRFVPPTPEQLDEHFPQLEILELIGSGGMGAVYKARQPGLDRLVALKILPPEVGRDPAFAERFTREARALARLSHPHIVTIHDSGQAGGYYYFVMEFVEGVNVRQMIRAGKLLPQEAMAIVPQICEALQYAHDEGIVHRDIKPENVLVDKQGRVKIADFGLAKLLGCAGADFTLTGTGQVMGTAHYMAPEQLERPLQVDHRADIYSLGVVFYEMLTGELPIGRFAPPSKKVHVDVRLDEVVLRALENEPERRYQNISEVKTDVESIEPDPPPPRQFVRPPVQHCLLIIAVTVIVAVGGPLLAAHWALSPALALLSIMFTIFPSTILAQRFRGTQLGVYARFSSRVGAMTSIWFPLWILFVVTFDSVPILDVNWLFGVTEGEPSGAYLSASRKIIAVIYVILIEIYCFGGWLIWQRIRAQRRK